MDERRQFERQPSSLKVNIQHPAFGIITGFARDISDGGAQVHIENQPCPPVGTVVNVTFKKMIGAINQEPVEMKVMHSHRNIVGLMFVR